jgi:uncharacterized protein
MDKDEAVRRTGMKKATRRDFLKAGAAAAGGAISAGSAVARAMGASSADAARLASKSGPVGRVSANQSASAPLAVTPPLAQFEYSQVQLLEGPFRQQFDHNHELFLKLDEDALLKPFRQRMGMPAPGPDMGGWYDNSDDFDPAHNFHGFIPGHSFGQYLSGLARAYAVTGSKPTQEKVHRLVKAFSETVDESGKFYVGYRLPAYTYDKTSCGLIDAFEFARDPMAQEVHWRATQAVLPHLPARALNRYEQRSRGYTNIAFTWDETYTLPENFFLAYQRMGDERYHELGIRFLEEDYLGPLSENANVLPFEHAYSHVNALSTAAQAYLVLGDEKYLRAAKNGLRMVQDQSYATGGWGPDEAFVEPGRGGMAASLKSTHASFETPCGAYGHFKITRYLLRVTGDSSYGDSMERVLYNTIGGARLIQPDGTSYYYSDYNDSDAQKVWYRDKWPCCSGTFPQLSADYGISTYFRKSDGVCVNLYLPSRMNWIQGSTPCSLTMKTDYPKTNTIQLELAAERPESFAIYLRIPAWAGAKTRLSVNGARAQGEVTPGKFFALKRMWKDGDRIEMEMEMPLRLEAVEPENADIVALMRGPVALFAIGDTPGRMTREQLLGASVSLQSSDDWVAKSDGGDVTLRTYAAIKDEKYRLYHQV